MQMQGKRGQTLEKIIEQSCETYRIQGRALIYKRPTPWNVHFDPRKRVNVAFPEEKSTVDFEGIWDGFSVAIEAKSTREDQRFPLKNIAEHQVQYLNAHEDHGGISFLIIQFDRVNKRFLLYPEQLREWWSGAKKGGRKSIPLNYFRENCPELRSKDGAALDFLEPLRQARFY